MSELTIVIGNKNYSSWSLRGWLAAKYTGLPMDEVKIDLYTPSSKAALLKHSPAGQVPVLKHGDALVWDSLAIIDYCARLVPEKFWWPEDNRAYGFARSIAAEMHSAFMALRTHAPMNLRARHTGLKLSDAVAADVRRVEDIWLEARSTFGEGGDFLFGRFSAADMMYAPVVTRFESYGIAVNDTARAYMTAVMDNPLMMKWREAAANETAVIAAAELPDGAIRLG